MPLYTVDTQKQQLTEYWTNRYIIEAATLQDAAVAVNIIWECESDIHTTNVMLLNARVRPLAPGGGDNYIIIPFGFAAGFEGGAIGTQIPLFNVVRVDLAVEVGRPSRKYYRTGLTESMVAGSLLEESYRSLVDTAVDTMRTALGTSFVDVDGQAIVGSSVIPTVAMRQLRRGSKRRITPVI